MSSFIKNEITPREYLDDHSGYWYKQRLRDLTDKNKIPSGRSTNSYKKMFGNKYISQLKNRKRKNNSIKYKKKINKKIKQKKNKESIKTIWYKRKYVVRQFQS